MGFFKVGVVFEAFPFADEVLPVGRGDFGERAVNQLGLFRDDDAAGERVVADSGPDGFGQD
eukprot:CAMPEP_0198318392 /NCGR_PEP_ID=MMETSP1450-20131203/7719_1 /TAXON_ID=753684 ORGANISM="Madagascaria erythrocladiodes, Strain CCMP3234" /NCGR_SAMPLE_ID=MMETSP1450 /ASSEMBLY_ACC=CAM_ASM_001115 /LENGTH=60 /DNA_ID=CAMNT_0044021689 /DNA_START=39 /DNA_END=218 /DNA_ORIENTATION=+